MVFRIRRDKEEEPCADDCSLAFEEDVEAFDLIWALLDYTCELEKKIVELRNRVNKLTPKEEQVPFPELHENIYQSFCDYQAYQKFQKYLEE